MPIPTPPRRLFWILLSGGLIGALYAGLRHDAPLFGALFGLAMSAAIYSLERFVLSRDPGALFARLPFLTHLVLRALLYAGLILFVDVAVNRLANPNGRGDAFSGVDMLFSLALSIGGNLLVGVNELLGPGVLFAFVGGRYAQPRREERVLLFIDMRSSTAIAERVGEERFLDLLNRFILDLSLAIVEAGGEIHKYVGDEVIVTWRLKPGANEARSVRACFAAYDRLVAQGPSYERDFGFRVDFRAALHCGTVVVGELGYLKKEIALIGDAMNTAARILEACRDTGCRVLASAALLERLAALPAGVDARPLGPLPVRGKEHALELYALEKAGGE